MRRDTQPSHRAFGATCYGRAAFDEPRQSDLEGGCEMAQRLAAGLALVAVSAVARTSTADTLVDTIPAATVGTAFDGPGTVTVECETSGPPCDAATFYDAWR